MLPNTEIPELEVYLQGFRNYSTTKVKCETLSKIIEAYNFWLRIPEDKLKIIYEVAEMSVLYGAILDDLIRDKKPLFITEALSDFFPSIMSVSLYANIKVLWKVKQINSADALKVYMKEWSLICESLAEEIHWRDTLKYPSEAKFRNATAQKNEFQFIYRLMAVFSDNKTNFTKITTLLQEFLQIHTDYCNFYTEDYTFLTTAKLNFPMLHALHYKNLEDPLLNLMRTGINNDCCSKYVINLIDNSGGLKYTQELPIELINSLKVEISQIPKNTLLTDFLENAATNVRNAKLKSQPVDSIEIKF